MDANRRQKESEVISRLNSLIRQQQSGAGQLDDDTADVNEDVDDTEGGKKAGRLAVLESSVALIEQLTAACRRMNAACNARDAQVSRVSSQLQSVAAAIAQQATSLALVESGRGSGSGLLASDRFGHWRSSPAPATRLIEPAPTAASSHFLSALPPSASSYLVHSDMAHTLHHFTTSLVTHMGITLVALPTMLVLDVNQAMLDMAGRSRSEVLYRPLIDLEMCTGISQFPTSVAAMNAVVEGKRRQLTTTWRCRGTDGLIYETNVWLSGVWDEPSTGSETDTAGAVKRERRSPDKMLVMCAEDEAVLVDELQVP